MGEKRFVRGEVVIPTSVPASESGTLFVQVEDVSRADAPSEIVGEIRLRNVEAIPGSSIGFEVAVPVESIHPQGLYSVRAHISRANDERVQKGDLLSTRSYPVLTRGAGDRVRVLVQQI